MGNDQIAHRFTFHTPTSDSIADMHTDMSAMGNEFAQYVDSVLPECREKSLALTKIEEGTMWANAAIARNLNS